MVATFDYAENLKGTRIEDEIEGAINQAITDLQAPDVRVEVEPTSLKADDRAGAETLGKRYDAGIVIWGSETAVHITVNFLNLNPPEFGENDPLIRISETQRTQMVDPARYASFVTRDLPGQLAFFSLFTVGQGLINESISSWPSNESHVEKGIQAIEGGIASLESKPENTDILSKAYVTLGEVHSGLGHDDRAIKNYTEAIDLAPDDSDADPNRGHAYIPSHVTR